MICGVGNRTIERLNQTVFGDFAKFSCEGRNPLLGSPHGLRPNEGSPYLETTDPHILIC